MGVHTPASPQDQGFRRAPSLGVDVGVGKRSKSKSSIEASLDRAIQYHLNGRLDAAERVYRHILSLEPEHFDANHLLGVIAFERGELETSLKYYNVALKKSDLVAELQGNIANSLKELGRYSEAARHYKRALFLKPNQADTHYNLGTMLHEGKVEGEKTAESHYLKAIELNPSLALAFDNLGNLYFDQGKHELALEQYMSALARGCDAKLIHRNLARSYECLQRREASLSHWALAIKACDEHARTLLDLARQWYAAKDFDGCLKALGILLSAKNDFDPIFSAEINETHGLALHAIRRYEQAHQSFSRALSLNVGNASVLNNMGNLLTELGSVDEAIASFEKAIQISPGFADAWSNLGVALNRVNQFHRAIQCYDEAIRIQPNYSDAYANKALALLAVGEFERGWPLFEWRWKHSASSAVIPNYPAPQWRGEASLVGKTLLVIAEQGYGDTIQFVRLLPRLKRFSPQRVMLELPQALVPLMADLAGVDRVVTQGDEIEHFDFQCPLLSLPFALGLMHLDFRDLPTPYLHVSSESVLAWQRMHEDFLESSMSIEYFPRHEDAGADRRSKLPTIGLAWRGNPSHINDAGRSIPTELFLSQLPVGPRYISLQKLLSAEDRIQVNRRPDIFDPAWRIHDFLDTGALCRLTDFMICVDTSVAHLAGALDIPCVMLISFSSDWRWPVGSTRSLWYPKMTIARQESPGDWIAPLATMRQTIERHLFRTELSDDISRS